MFGVLQKDSLKAIADITPREAMTLLPLVAATLYFGVYPAPIMTAISASVDNLLVNMQTAFDAQAAVVRAAAATLGN